MHPSLGHTKPPNGLTNKLVRAQDLFVFVCSIQMRMLDVIFWEVVPSSYRVTHLTANVSRLIDGLCFSRWIWNCYQFGHWIICCWCWSET